MAATGFIGTGTIGGPMAMRLVGAGHALTVFDLDPQATRALEDQGATRAAAVADVAAECTTVFLSLPGPKQIEQVMFGADGVLAHARPGTIVVDLSTNAIALNRQIAERAATRGMHYLDAPVSGGRAGAIAGKLAVMVGGDQAAFITVRPLIACFGENIFHLGEAGAGTLTKLINNQIFLAASVLVQEGFVMGAKAGMDPNNLPEGDKATMSFQAGESSKAKAWKDVWGSGQGIGAIKSRMPAAQYVSQLKREYEDAWGEPTRSNNRPFLIKRIAWRRQALSEGGLSERAKRS